MRLSKIGSEIIFWNKCDTGGPVDMRILGLVKTGISGKSHSENQKVVILYCMIFIMYEIEITFQLLVYSLSTI